MSDSSPGRANRQPAAVEHVAGAEAVFSGLIHDLVECGEDVVAKLDLGDGCEPHAREPDGKRADALAWDSVRTCSQSGVLKTLSVPYFSFSPWEQRKTPPNLTSSPKRKALGFEANLLRVGAQFYVEGVVDGRVEVHLLPVGGLDLGGGVVDRSFRKLKEPAVD